MNLKSIFVLLLFLVVSSFAVAAQEGTPEISPTTQRVVQAAMVVDCTTLSPDALSYARQHGICQTANGGISTQGSGSNTGNCGTVTLTIDNNFMILHNATFSVRFQSTVGLITATSYSIPWTNLNTQYGNTVVGGAAVWLNTVYTDSKIVFTGKGKVTGVLTGTVWVNAILSCTIIPTTATGDIK